MRQGGAERRGAGARLFFTYARIGDGTARGRESSNSMIWTRSNKLSRLAVKSRKKKERHCCCPLLSFSLNNSLIEFSAGLQCFFSPRKFGTFGDFLLLTACISESFSSHIYPDVRHLCLSASCYTLSLVKNKKIECSRGCANSDANLFFLNKNQREQNNQPRKKKKEKKEIRMLLMVSFYDRVCLYPRCMPSRYEKRLL